MQLDRRLARQIIEALRKGIPPERGTSFYSVGDEKLIESIKNEYLEDIKDKGIIRFISGSWGSGKTHFFRLMRDVSFTEECLVSNVELNRHDAAFNKFEQIFVAIVKNIATPSHFTDDSEVEIAPFGRVLEEALSYLSKGSHEINNKITRLDYDQAKSKLASNPSIDEDFCKMINHYWRTCLTDLTQGSDLSAVYQRRQEILQWFSGEGTITTYKQPFGVNKVIKSENAKDMLRSLVAFVKLAGYRGIVILFDEAETYFSCTLRSSTRLDAFNNLRDLIDTISKKLKGLFVLYAATPDFYKDNRTGIVTYAALKERIGKLPQHPPNPLQKVWNLDEISAELDTYHTVSNKIRDIYLVAYPTSSTKIPSQYQTNDFVDELKKSYSDAESMRFWRLMVSAIIENFDAHQYEQEVLPAKKIFRSVMDKLAED